MRAFILTLPLGLWFVGNAHGETPVLQTQDGAVVHWGKPILEVGLDPREASRGLSQDSVRGALMSALETWNRVKAGQPQLYYAEQRHVDITVRFCQKRWTGSSVDLGHSEFVAAPQTGLLQDGVIQINECDRAFSGPGEVVVDRHSLAAVLAHELGHLFGLGHSKNSASLMFPTGGGARIRTPQPEDVAALAAIYLGRFSDGMEKVATSAAKISDDRSPRPALRTAIPAHATPLMRVKTPKGRELLIYTCEPTLLPPIGEMDPSPNAAVKRRKSPR